MVSNLKWGRLQWNSMYMQLSHLCHKLGPCLGNCYLPRSERQGGLRRCSNWQIEHPVFLAVSKFIGWLLWGYDTVLSQQPCKMERTPNTSSIPYLKRCRGLEEWARQENCTLHTGWRILTKTLLLTELRPSHANWLGPWHQNRRRWII